MEKTYEPNAGEARWYKFWEERGFFIAPIVPDKEPFTIVIPPPNITGSLHMGHALNNTIQDVIVRRKRMQGFPTLWLPGTDHAGIATQNKVEQQLAKEGMTREDLGRERFIERVWQWKEKYGNTIIGQLKRLGCSCDWSRERFTMDDGYSKAVREVFVRLYHDGLIYRGNRIINWCPRCHTALSDIEVDHRDIEGSLWHIRYPLIGEEGDLIIATTRPETMLGDTAIAVNPEDGRYRNLIGKKARLPLVGRELPIIADDHVDPSFGTGALKVTPAHDPNDFEIGKRHDLEEVNILEPDGRINENGGRYKGMDRQEARREIVSHLSEEGLLLKVEPHEHAVGHCYRCHTVIEPYLSDQWFVDMKPLAQEAITVVKEGKVKFVPAKWERLYFDWMENIRDWCISRQIWWGHQIPAWYCDNCGELIVQMEEPEICPKCESVDLRRDGDVLDTWFSSALWPFATLGWPDTTDDLDYFYPTSVLSTARDILYLWVARMVMCGLKFAGDVPYHTVIIHPTVLNPEGKRMSKSLGTGVDPLDLIDVFGTDATRFGLMIQNTPMQDMRFSEDKLAMSRNFANKIWNASRFVMMNLDGGSNDALHILRKQNLKPESLEDRWILSRLQRLIAAVDLALEEYNFSEASRALYDFFWSEFCDWYLELVKPRLYTGIEGRGPMNDMDTGFGAAARNRQTAQFVSVNVLDTALRLLHPFMPFLTEDIWQRLPLEEKGKSIMVSQWPEIAAALIDEVAETRMGEIQSIISAIRTIRSELKVAPSKRVSVAIKAADSKSELLLEYGHMIKDLAKVGELRVGLEVERPPKSAIAIEAGAEVYMPLEDLIDIEKEMERLRKEIAQVDEILKKITAKLDNPNFSEKAPPDIVASQEAKQEDLTKQKAKLEHQLELLG